MKRINLLLLVFSLLTIVLISESCKKDESCPTIDCNTGTLNDETCACDCPIGFSGISCEIEDSCVTQNVECQNGGTCVDGICECPVGYIGTNCESFDPSQVQALLANHTPIDLVNGGVPIDSLYGKMYEGGIIFYLNTDNGTGMVAATEDQSPLAEWGCVGTDIAGLNNVQASPVDPETEEGARVGDGAANTNAILAACEETGIAAKLCRDFGTGWFLPSRGELNLMYTNLHLNGHGGFAADIYWSSSERDGFVARIQFFTDGFQGTGAKDVSYRVRAARAF